MARARNIKPSFFTNDTLAECSPLARLLFAGLWTIADREGRLECRPKKIKAEILPYDDCDINSLLSDLEKHGFITRYDVNGNQYIQVLNFVKHQNPHMREAASTIPAPDEHGASPAPSPIPLTHSLNPLPSNPDPVPAPKTPKKKKPEKISLQEWEEANGELKLDLLSKWIEEKGLDVAKLTEELAVFRQKCVAKAYQYADFPSAFQGWVANKEYGNGLHKFKIGYTEVIDEHGNPIKQTNNTGNRGRGSGTYDPTRFARVAAEKLGRQTQPSHERSVDGGLEKGVGREIKPH